MHLRNDIRTIIIYIIIIILAVRVCASCLAPDTWKNSLNNHVILKEVDVEVIKVIQLASEVHN